MAAVSGGGGGARHLAVFCFFAALHLVAIALFTRGFFLTRIELSNVSSCSELPLCTYQKGVEGTGSHKSCVEVPRLLRESMRGTGNGECWFPARFRRVVMIVIDALRFDFVEYWGGTGEFGGELESSERAHYVDRLPVIHETLTGEETASRSLLFRLQSDSPTVTMQRLKALVTGGIPTFVDLNDVNFESSAVQEDNIVHQLKRQGREIAFMGDDTWVQLFPASFDVAYDYPSFNAKDLHTVDNGVLEHLVPELSLEKWNFLVAHFLGVDHAGHRYGPSHPAMGAKLSQMDGMIRDVLPLIDEDTLLLVLGDHGMTQEGNHGGSSYNETYSALFAYSGRPIAGEEASSMRGRTASLASHVSTVSQIDLTPTIAFILGIPAPFGSLGRVIPEMLVTGGVDVCSLTRDARPAEVSALIDLLSMQFVNSWQVYAYLDAYTAASSQFSARHTESLRERLLANQRPLESLDVDLIDRLRSGTASLSELEVLCDVVEGYRSVLEDTVDMCREQWAEFDLWSMRVSLAIILLGITAMCLQIVFLRPTPILFLVASGAGGLAGALLALWFKGADDIFWLCGCVAVGAVAGHIGALLSHIRSNWAALPSFTQFDRRWYLAAFGVLLVALHGYCLFTNSFIEVEEVIVRYLLSGAVVVLGISALVDSKDQATQVLVEGFGALLWIRLSAGFTQGRHEGHFPYATALSSAVHLGQVTCCAFAPAAVAWFSRRGQASSLSLLHVLTTVLVSMSICVYWALQPTLMFEHWPIWQKNLLPRVAYAASLLNLVLVGISTRLSGLSARQASVAALTALAGPLSLVLGSWFALAIGLMGLEGLALLSLLKRAMRGTSGSDRISVIAPAVWALLTLQFYFATGHHWQFSSLQFESAYIGFEEFNYAAGGVAVLCNTFAAPILAVAALPLLEAADSGDERWHGGATVALPFLCWFSFDLALTSVFVFIERRHLMVWRVFAPKFLFSSAFLVVLAVLLASFQALCALLRTSKKVKAK